MLGSRNFRSKNTLNKSGTKDISHVGFKSYQPTVISKRVATSNNFSFKAFGSAIEMPKMQRKNTHEVSLKKEYMDEENILLKSSVRKPNFAPRLSRVSVSNMSLMSIQKDMNTSSNLLNSLIVKSPTLARHKRKSSFLNNLPETLKKVMNLNVSSNGARRSSFQSGRLIEQALANSEDKEEGLSEIESEESGDSNQNDSHHSNPKTKKNRSSAFKSAFRKLKKTHFKTISRVQPI